MKFEWDEAKRLSNVEKHGFNFIDVWQLFEGDHIKASARRGTSGEQRFLATGFINGLYATVIYTVRGSVTGIISLRKARADERNQHQALHHR